MYTPGIPDRGSSQARFRFFTLLFFKIVIPAEILPGFMSSETEREPAEILPGIMSSETEREKEG